MSDQSWYRIENKADDSAEVLIYNEVGLGVSAFGLVREVRASTAKTINVRLNTPGGRVMDGLAIYNALRSSGKRVVVHVDGMAASIGSVIAMAGDEIRMAKNAYMMIHNPMGAAVGDSDDMRHLAKQLDSIKDTIAETYADRSGGKKTKQEFMALMDAETWFTAKEAKAAGLADVVTDADGEPIKAYAGAIFNKAPEAVARAMRGETQISEGGGRSDATTSTAPNAGPESETTMSQPNTAATANQAVEPKPATIAELKAAFPTDPAFALESAEKAYTLTEAKAAYADVLQAKLTEQATEITNLKAQTSSVENKVGNAALGGNVVENKGGDAVAFGTAKAEFNGEVRKLVNSGEYDHAAAVRFVAKDKSDLYQRMLDEANKRK